MKSRLYRWADRWAVRLADRMGVTLARAKPLDLRGQDLHPLEAYYRAKRYQPVLMDIPVAKLRGLSSAAFPCDQSSRHPFIQTLRDYDSGKIQSAKGSALERFYSSWQPSNAAEFFGLDQSKATNILRSLNPIEAVFPWYSASPKEMEFRYKYEITRAHNTHYEDVSSKNFLECGPVDSDYLDNEFSRLVTLYSSLKKGYGRKNSSDGDITGLLMLSDNYWFVHVQSGQHRVSSLSALGFNKIPIRLFFRLPMIVRREDSSYWPHVIDGMYSKEDALSIFDRMRDGIQPF